MTKSKWLKIVKEACKEKAFSDLLDKQSEYSKGSTLQYGNLKMRTYLKTNLIHENQARLIFKIRTRMLNVKNNFKNNQTNLCCPICQNDEDSQEHMMMKCSILENKITSKEFLTMFGCDEEKMAEVVKKVEMIVNERNYIIENATEINPTVRAHTDQVHLY